MAPEKGTSSSGDVAVDKGAYALKMMKDFFKDHRGGKDFGSHIDKRKVFAEIARSSSKVYSAHPSGGRFGKTRDELTKWVSSGKTIKKRGVPAFVGDHNNLAAPKILITILKPAGRTQKLWDDLGLEFVLEEGAVPPEDSIWVGSDWADVKWRYDNKVTAISGWVECPYTADVLDRLLFVKRENEADSEEVTPPKKKLAQDESNQEESAVSKPEQAETSGAVVSIFGGGSMNTPQPRSTETAAAQSSIVPPKQQVSLPPDTTAAQADKEKRKKEKQELAALDLKIEGILKKTTIPKQELELVVKRQASHIAELEKRLKMTETMVEFAEDMKQSKEMASEGVADMRDSRDMMDALTTRIDAMSLRINSIELEKEKESNWK